MMNSKLYSLGGRMGNIGVSELPKDKAKADVVCSVLFLDGTTQCFNISKQDDGQILLDMVYNHLGLMEREFFCLQLVEDPSDSPRWLEPNKPIKKQHKDFLTCVQRSYPCRLSFRVRFFVADPNSLLQEQTRHFYFLQLKNDIQNGRLNCPLSSAVVLASYAVQSEFGDHSPSKHPPGYLSSCNFLPKQDDDFLTKVESLHLQHSGLKSSEAELCYLNTARTLEFYGVELHRGRDSSNADLSVGIASGGVAIFRNMICSSFFSWVNIIKLSFKRKRFYIQLKQKKENRDTGVSFHMPSNRACKNLWRSCVEHHTFFQARSPLPQDKKLFSNYWTFSSKNPSKSLNNQIFQKLMGGMAWNPVLRRSISGEHLETKSLPSRSPPITPNWRSPRLRHNIRKPPHSSMENLGNEMSYVTESEDVFYTYRGTLASGGSDDEAQTDPCISQKKLHFGVETEDATRKLPHSNKVSRPGSREAVWSVPGPLEGIDLESAPEDKADDPDSQYYCNKNDVIEGDLLLVRITPDKEGKFGFNVKGGVDQKMPLVISRVSLDSPAGKCVPPLLEGDQIVLINGRDISEHTHDQVVMFIKASRESHTKELALLVRRKGVGLRVEPHEYKTFPVFGDPISPSSYQCGGTLSESMVHLKRGLQNGVLLAQFEQLYRKKPGLSMSVAKSSQNMEKNRYKDVLPYDITRVVLGEEEDGYINASHVKMEIPAAGIVNQYMAGQGPLPHTCGHFWQAVWEQQVCVIVMLTTLTERGRPKCHQYWPDPPEVRDYGYLRVCCHSEECNLAYVFRQLTLTNTENGEERTVTHLQYVAWPDHGVPDDPSDFLDFVNFVQHQKGEGDPLVVHCSAGIGRTGVFITMETAMKLMEKDQPVHPLDLVRRLRDQRAMMVQTVSQYRFVCEAILRVYRERQDGALSPNS